MHACVLWIHQCRAYTSPPPFPLCCLSLSLSLMHNSRAPARTRTRASHLTELPQAPDQFIMWWTPTGTLDLSLSLSDALPSSSPRRHTPSLAVLFSPRSLLPLLGRALECLQGRDVPLRRRGKAGGERSREREREIEREKSALAFCRAQPAQRRHCCGTLLPSSSSFSLLSFPFVPTGALCGSRLLVCVTGC